MSDVEVAGDALELGSGENTEVPEVEDLLGALVDRWDHDGVVMRPKGCTGAPGSRSQWALSSPGGLPRPVPQKAVRVSIQAA